MRSLLGAFFLLVFSVVAAAHERGVEPSAGTSIWTYDLWVVVPLAAMGALYFAGTARLWAHAGRSRGIPAWRAACFWIGWASFWLALVSPLHWLGERLFVAHMGEHAILIGVAAPLIAISRPTAAAFWAVPRQLSYSLAKLTHQSWVARPWSALTEPLSATFIHGVAIWAWHIPRLYDLAVVDPTAHRLQHLSFSLTALLFWWALVRSEKYGTAVFCLFLTALHTSLLGLLLTLSSRLWYPPQVALAADWGLTPLEDQQLAGLVMWVPMGVIYTAAGLGFAGRWIARASRHSPSLFSAAQPTRV